MLNVLNLATSLKDRFLNQRNSLIEILEPYIDGLADKELDIDLTYTSPEAEVQISHERFQTYYDMFEKLVQHTVYMTDGTVIGVTKSNWEDATHYHYIYSDALHNNAEICRLIYEHIEPEEGEQIFTYYIAWNGWDVTHRSTLADKISFLYQGFLEAEAISTTILTAIDLCSKGQLDPTNLAASLSTLGVNISGSVKEVVNMLIANVSGTDAHQQAVGLVKSLGDIFKDVNATNITEDDGTINFHTTEYTITGAIILPFDSLIGTIGSVIGAIIAYFGSPIGFVVAAASQAIAGLYSAAETTFGDDWNINVLSGIDNESCAVPFFSGSFPVANVPQKIVDYTKTYGYLRSENALFTVYTWMPTDQDPSREKINVEVFYNVNVSYKISQPNEDWSSLFYDILNCVDYTTSDTQYTFTGTAAGIETTNVANWFGNGDFSPVTPFKIQYPPEDLITYDNFQNRAITFYSILQFAFMAFRTLSAHYRDVPIVFNYGANNATFWYTAGRYIGEDPSKWNQSQCEHIIVSFLHWFSLHTQDLQLAGWGSDMIAEGWKVYTQGLINFVYKAILRLRVHIPNLAEYTNGDFFTIFNSVIDMGSIDNARDLKGEGYKWSCSPAIIYDAGFMFAPPKNRFSFTTRLITTTIVLTAVAAATAAATYKIKKRISYKAQKKQAELQELRDKFNSSQSYADYSALYSATKKYNRTYGLLTGTSYDMTNAWVNETKNSALSSSMSSAYPNMVGPDSEGKATIDLTPVISLIK